MCKAASSSLGSGNSTPPSGDQGVNSATGTCPNAKKPAAILVEVYEGNSATLVKDVNVSVSGPSSGSPTDFASATKHFSNLTPGDGYEVTVAYENVEKFKDGRLVRSMPSQKQFKLGSGETLRVIYRLYPAETALVVEVVDADTGGIVTGTVFEVEVPKLKKKENTTADTGRVKVLADPGDYDGIKVDLSDPVLKQRYVLAESGKVTVQRGKPPGIAKVKLKVRQLRLTGVDRNFAPSIEQLDIKYEIRSMEDQQVWLQIQDAEKAVLYERELALAEKADGRQKVIHWDGKTNQAAGAFQAGQYINPLSGPYTVVLVHPITRAYIDVETRYREQAFHVLYDSISIELMPWKDLYLAVTGMANDAFPRAANDSIKRRWLQYKLNDLGFWAGPIDGSDSDDLKKAIRRFRFAHPKLSGWFDDTPPYEGRQAGAGWEMDLRTDILNGFTDSDQALVDVLEAAGTRTHFTRRMLDNPEAITDATRNSRLFVEAHRFHINEFGEFSAPNQPRTKLEKEREWLSRPHLPLRATILLKNKRGERQAAPAAVGNPDVLWSWEDTDEATLSALESSPGQSLAPSLPTPTSVAPSQTKAYVYQTQAALKIGSYFGTREQASAPGGAGAAVPVGGIITGVDDADRVVAFARCEPTPAAHYAEDPALGVRVRAQADAPAREGVTGASFIYLKPSIIAGDNYKVRAKLDLTDAMRRPDFAAASPADIQAETGRLVVWRRMRLAAYVPWPPRNGFNAATEFGKIAKEFALCMVELDHSACKTFAIGDVITWDDFVDVLDEAKRRSAQPPEPLEPALEEPYWNDFVRSQLRLSTTAMYPAPAESYPDSPTFNAFVNRLTRFANLKGRLAAFVAAGSAGTAAQDAVAAADPRSAAVRAAQALERATTAAQSANPAPTGPAADLAATAAQAAANAAAQAATAAAANATAHGGAAEARNAELAAQAATARAQEAADAVSAYRAALTAARDATNANASAAVLAPLKSDVDTTAARAAGAASPAHAAAVAAAQAAVTANTAAAAAVPANADAARAAAAAASAAATAIAGALSATQAALLKDVTVVMKTAQAWKRGTEDLVRQAGNHFVTQLDLCLNTAISPWDLKNAGYDASTFPLLALGGGGSEITTAQIWDLLLNPSLRDEIEKYEEADVLDAAYASGFKNYLTPIKNAPANRMEKDFVGGLVDTLLILNQAGDRFRTDWAKGARRMTVYRLRKNIVDRRIGTMGDKIKNRLLERINLKVRKKLASAPLPRPTCADDTATDGAIFFDYRMSDPIPMEDGDYIVEGVAFGGVNGVASLDQGLRAQFYSLAAHELAHCLFLQHWKNTGNIEFHLHDLTDDNCLMSYPSALLRNDYTEANGEAWLKLRFKDKLPLYGGWPARGGSTNVEGYSNKPHYCWDRFQPHFCGKCNLQLRGWNIIDVGVPTHSAVAMGAPSRPVGVPVVRLIRGTLTDDAPGTPADAIAGVGISFYPSDKTGRLVALHPADPDPPPPNVKKGFSLGDLKPFPKSFGYDPDAAADPNVFRVEVIDPNREEDHVFVTLEALQPRYAGDNVAGHAPFAEPERGRRALVDVECIPISSDPHCYRSRYIRLVMDEADHAALAPTKQGLLITDMADGLNGPNDQVEILDQKIRAIYDPAR